MKTIVSLILAAQVIVGPSRAGADSKHICSRQFFIARGITTLSTFGLASLGTISAVAPLLTKRYATASRTKAIADEFELALPTLEAWFAQIKKMEKAGAVTGLLSFIPFSFTLASGRFQNLVGRVLVEIENDQIGYQTTGLQSVLNHAIFGQGLTYMHRWADFTDLSGQLRSQLASALQWHPITAVNLQNAIRSLMKTSSICFARNSEVDLIQLIVFSHLALKENLALSTH